MQEPAYWLTMTNMGADVCRFIRYSLAGFASHLLYSKIAEEWKLLIADVVDSNALFQMALVFETKE